jgi:hypothetical protein
MKKFLLIFVMLIFKSFAAERAIYDVMYQPLAGTTFGISEFNSTLETVDSSAGDYEVSGPRLKQTFGRSISDELSLSLSLNYADLTTDPNQGKSFENEGISDPTFTSRYRLYDEKFRWDLLAGFRASLKDAEVESNGDTNNVEGGHALSFGTQFGEKSEKFQWAILANATYNFKRRIDQPGANNEEYNSKFDVILRGDILNQLAEKSFLRSFVSYEMLEGVTPVNSSVNVDSVYAPEKDVYTIGAEYQHLISTDLLLRGGVSYATVKTDSGSVDSYNSWAFNLGANYQF